MGRLAGRPRSPSAIRLHRARAGLCQLQTCCAVQHHRAHIASVLAEREAWDEARARRQLRRHGLRRRRHHLGRRDFRGQRGARLRARRASAPGRAARRRCGGALSRCRRPPDFWRRWTACPTLTAAPFHFPARYQECSGTGATRASARSPPPPWDGFSTPPPRCWASPGNQLSKDRRRCGWSSSQLSLRGVDAPYPFPFDGEELDFRPLLAGRDRRSASADEMPAEIARDFHRGVAQGLSAMPCMAIWKLVIWIRGFVRRSLPERTSARRSEVLLARRRLRGLDEPRRPAQRWRHQPGTGCAGRFGQFDARDPDEIRRICMNFRLR